MEPAMFRRQTPQPEAAPRLDHRDGALVVTAHGAARIIPDAGVTDILECAMADPIAHGEEEFHIVVTADEILIVGPFVAGGLEAVDALTRDRPEIARRRRHLFNIPLRFREPGLSRLFPVAGLHVAPRAALADLPFVEQD